MSVPPAILAVADRIDGINAAIGRLAAWLVLFVVLMQFAVVVMRYAFGSGSIWMAESIVYAHATVVLMAAAWTLREEGHVRVDLFYTDASPRTRAWVNLGGALLLLLPLMAVVLWFTWPYMARSWAILERSRETSGIPAVFLLKTLIPVFAVMMAMQGVSLAIRSAHSLAQR